METKLEIKFSTKKDKCECCNRPFDSANNVIETPIIIDIAKASLYVPKTSENRVYEEDLLSYINDYLSDELEDRVDSSDVYYVNRTETTKVFLKLMDYLKQNGVKIISPI